MHEQSKFRTVISIGIVLFLHIIAVYCFLSNPRISKIDPSTVNPLWITSIVQPSQLPPATQHSLARDNLSPDKFRHKIATNSATTIPSPSAPQETFNQPAQPVLDLETLRAQAVEQEMRRIKSPVEIMNEKRLKNNSIEAHLEDAATGAQRTDCLKAHSEYGLFAPLMIARDLIRDKGCKF